MVNKFFVFLYFFKRHLTKKKTIYLFIIPLQVQRQWIVSIGFWLIVGLDLVQLRKIAQQWNQKIVNSQIFI